MCYVDLNCVNRHSLLLGHDYLMLLFSVILYFTFNRFLLSVSGVEKLSSLPKSTAQPDVSISHVTNTADEVKPQDKSNTKEHRSSEHDINTVGEANAVNHSSEYNYINIY